MNPVLTFHPSAKRFVLGALGKALDEEKYLVEKDNPEQKVLTIDGQEIKFSEFAGVRHGSEIFIKSDIASLVLASDFIGR